MSSFSELRVVTPARWLVQDLSLGAASNRVHVVQDYGFDLPASTERVAWWCPGTYVARLHASGTHPAFTSPHPTVLVALPQEVLRRQVELTPLRLIRHATLVHNRDEVFLKVADAKIPGIEAAVIQVDRFADLAYANGMAEPSLVLVSEPVHFQREFRVFIHRNIPVAASPYLIDGITWDGLDPASLPDTREAIAFARDVADTLGGRVPAGYVLDVGSLEDGRWAVVETNPAWASNPYWATEQDADGVVATILAAQEPGQTGHEWVPDQALVRRARHLPLRQGQVA